MSSALRFERLAGDAATAARRGRLTLGHGTVETPAFMPVGTAGSVKAVSGADVERPGAEIVLANTYHLMLRPGGDVVRRLGGLHRFTGWPKPILTDSGGFQVMSLAANRKVREDGVLFRSHLDGSEHLLTPERAAELQLADFGVDVAMVLDECTPYPASREVARASMERTHRWAARALTRAAALRAGGAAGALFGIVQGGMHEDLRAESVAALAALPFEGLACGGVSVGEPKPEMRAIVAFTGPRLPPERPRYLMGVGRPDDLIHAVAHGFDLFDCVLPTRAARHGLLYTSEGTLVVKHARYREDAAPPDPACSCATCRRHSRAYLRHLWLAGEPSAALHLTVHNLTAILDLMRRIREALDSGEFATWSAEAAARLSHDDRKDAT
ncbi:MAG TPA: tRNA guanosine(34) transglycosylase Tgt [Thermoanaerobaculia bacterium]|nr:tRNA guanosine(34) transglycosylase Tgt [Thermoanaerobaculia bacterium]